MHTTNVNPTDDHSLANILICYLSGECPHPLYSMLLSWATLLSFFCENSVRFKKTAKYIKPIS